MGRLVTAALVVGVAVMAFYLYNPIPDGIDQAWQYNLLVTAVRVMSDISAVGGKLGLADERVCIRHMLALSDIFPADPPEGVNVSDLVFDGVPVRLYVPDRPSNGKRGGLVYLHGGGFIAGSPKGHDSHCLWLANRLELVIASVHYRRVPEHPSPTPLSDSYTASRHFYDHSHMWGVDPTRIGVSGDSAGGNLAAALTLKVRDEWRRRASTGDGDFRFRFQVLSYPLLQGLTQNLPSYLQNDYHAIKLTKRWTVAGVVWSYIRGMQNYRHFYPYQLNETHIPITIKKRYGQYVDWRKLPQHLIKPDFEPFPDHSEYFDHLDVAEDLVNPYNFPLMADDLTDLPPSYVLTAEFDTLRDEGILYAQRLEEAGGVVVHDYFAKGWHGMVSGLDGVFSFDITKHAMNNITRFIEKQIS